MRAPSRTVERARRLRREMTLPEVVLWSRLRRAGLDGLRFRRQHPLGPYVLDFFCAEARLAVEVDGMAHDSPGRAEADALRTAWLAGQGIAVLRLPARDVLRGEAEHVLPTIAAACAERLSLTPRPLHRPSDGPPPPRAGEEP